MLKVWSKFKQIGVNDTQWNVFFLLFIIFARQILMKKTWSVIIGYFCHLGDNLKCSEGPKSGTRTSNFCHHLQPQTICPPHLSTEALMCESQQITQRKKNTKYHNNNLKNQNKILKTVMDKKKQFTKT